MSNITVGEAKSHATTLAAMASAFLSALADGKHPDEVAITEDVLKALAVAFPPLAVEFAGGEKALEAFVFLNKLTGGGKMVAVPQGGFVPFKSPRVMPDGSLRNYDPAIDGR